MTDIVVERTSVGGRDRRCLGIVGSLLGEGVEFHEKLTPVRRIGRPEDIAALCSFLVRDEASYITGQVLGVNGGRNT